MKKIELKTERKSLVTIENTMSIEEMENNIAGMTFCQSLVVIDGAILSYGWAASVWGLTPIGAGTGVALLAMNAYCAFR